MTDRRYRCPECAQSKHRNCTWFVLDPDDELVPCGCKQADHMTAPARHTGTATTEEEQHG